MADNTFITVVPAEVHKQNKLLIADLDAIIQKITEYNKLAKEAVLPSQNKSVIQGINKEIDKSNKLLSESEKFNKKLAASEEGLRFAKSKTGRQTIKNRQETAKLNKETRSLSSAFDKLKLSLDKAEKEYKDLAASTGLTSKSTKRAKVRVDKLRKSVEAIQNPIRKFGTGIKRTSISLRSLVSAFGFTSGIFLFASAVRGAIKTFTDFDQSQADLAAILGKSKVEIEALTNQALHLGATTAFTATQVAELQLELSKLGFKEDEILAATLGVENLAVATGVDAARAAKLAGASLRGFALDAEEANRVAAALAVSTTKSASTFESLETSLPKVSAIAKSFGFSIEDTTALLGSLSNAGFESSIAGTSLRQIFLQLADGSGKLAKRLGGPVKNFDDLIDKFKELDKSGIDLSEAFQLTNARSVAAFKVFLSGAEDIRTLRNEITDVETELDVLAQEKLNSVKGQITLLNSAWEGWILSLDSSNKGANKLKKGIAFLTKNLDRILSTILKVIKFFVAYKAVLLAVNGITRLYTAGTIALRIAKVALSRGIMSAAKAMKAFNTASKANIIGALTGILATSVAAWFAFKNGVNGASEALKSAREEANKTRKAIVAANIALVKDQLKLIDETITNQKEATAEKIRLINEEIEGRKDGSKVLSEVEQKRADDDKKRRDQLLKDISDFAKGVDEKDVNEIERIKEKVKGIQELDKARKDVLKTSNTAQTVDVVVGDLSGTAETIKELQEILRDLVKTQNDVSKSETLVGKDNSKDRFDLAKLILKNSIDTEKAISKDKTRNLTERATAQRNFMNLSFELIELERDFAVKSAKGSSLKIIKAEKEAEFKRIKIAKDGQKSRENILKESFTGRIQELKEISDAEKLQLNKDLIALKSNLLDKNATIEDIKKQEEDLIKESNKRILESQIKLIEDELSLLVMTTEEKKLLEKKLLGFKLALLGNEQKAKEEAEKTEKQRIADRISLIKDAFGQLDGFFGISGDALGDFFSGIENGFESSADAARTFADIASGALDYLAEQQRARTQEQLDRLDKEKEIQLAFAGESADARGAIEEDFAEKKKRIQEKQAKADKTNAIFQSLIGTASAVVAALGSAPFGPQNFALAAAVGALGLAQTAVIASQPIPQFKDGVTGFSGGLAMVNDQKGSNYKEIIRTPDGKMTKINKRNAIVNLPKGTDVLTAKETLDHERNLNSMLANNGVIPMRDKISNNKVVVEASYSGVTKEDLYDVMSKTVGRIQTNNVAIDKKGITTFAASAHGKREIMNNKVRFIGKSV